MICRAREQSLGNGELVVLAAEVDTCLFGALGCFKKAELKLVEEWKQEAAEMWEKLETETCSSWVAGDWHDRSIWEY